MPRTMLALVLLTPMASAAPVPKEKGKEVLYFPTTVGTTWESQTSFGGSSTSSVRCTVTKVAEKDGVREVTFQCVVGGVTTDAVYEVSPKGVWRRSEGGDPVPVFKAGEKAGSTWETVKKERGGEWKTTFTAGDEEEVETPAGKFQAVRVSRVINGGGLRQEATDWYAPGVGLVKSVHLGGPVDVTTELKAFAPGTPAKK